MSRTITTKTLYMILIASAMLLILALQASAVDTTTKDPCGNRKIGIVGASNSEDVPGKWSAILKSKCLNSQFFIQAKEGYSPVKQNSELLPKVLANDIDLLIISPSGNGVFQDAAYIAAVKDMAKNAGAKGVQVAVLSITPRKYYCYCSTPKCAFPVSKTNWQQSTCTYKWSEALQKKVDAFNLALLKQKLASSDINYVVDIYTPLQDSSEPGKCGYCGKDGGHLTKSGGEILANTVINTVFKGVQPTTSLITRTCGKHVAAVGDSITVGGSYVVDLRKLCGTSTTIKNEDGNPETSQRGRTTWAKGASGDKFAWGGKRTKEMKKDFADVLATNPDTVIILGGTNDIFGSWESTRVNLLDMYKMAKARNIRVVAVTIPPYKNNDSRKQSVQDNIKKLNNWIMTQSPADIKVNIYDSMVTKGTDDADPNLFGGDLVHPNRRGKAVMAQKIHAALTSTTAPTAPGAPTALTSIPAAVLPKTLYDFIIKSSDGITTVVGIARQNIAIGINKTPPTLAAAAVCLPITADKKYDLDWFKRTYGRNQLEVESQLVNVKFMKEDVRVHRLISPALGCVEQAIKQCAEGKSYTYETIESYSWKPLNADPSLLSTSSFGISLRINLDTNPNSQDNTLTTDIPNCTIDAFKRYGFNWGGDFTKTKSPSHFEFMADPSKIVVQQKVTCPPGTTRVTVPSNSKEAMGSAKTQGITPTGAITNINLATSSTPDSLAGNSDFVWPIPESSGKYWNNIVSCYGFRDLGGGKSFHAAVDVAALQGTPLVAITDGTIHSVCKVPDQCSTCNPLQYRRFKKGDCYRNGKFSTSKCGTCSASDSVCNTNKGRCYGFGSNVVIKHASTLYTHYVHLNKIADGISRGAKVTKGQQIGTVGNTGYSQGNHLHFAVHNKVPQTKTGNAAYPKSGVNPFCYFPDSVLTRLNIKRGSCVPLYGGSGNVVSSTNSRLEKECKLADLSALSGKTPTPAGSVPQNPAAGKTALVQVCRPDAAVPAVKGMTVAKGLACNYCNQGKELLKTLDPSAYASCRGTCCKGACPSDAVVNNNVPFLSQCTASAAGPGEMGPGGDCYYNTWTEAEKKAVKHRSDRYCASACGVAALRMTLKSYNKDKTSKELYCPGPDRIYVPGEGSSTQKIATVAQKTGLTGSGVTWRMNWNDLTSQVKSGKPIVLFVSDIKMGYTERPYKTTGHYVTVYGASDNYVIAHDPGRRASAGKSVVLSKSYVEKAGGRYITVA
jgi:murein DD-endopeptidase MepM/ murein hydrolase activator NlpD/lysophospholipase L1-like esterase